MPKLRVHGFGVSVDGFGAALDQDIDHPIGVGGFELFKWFFPTRTFQRMHGNADGTTGVDNDFAERGFAGIGAWILGRNMFGPVRGPWPDDSWKGWWGDTPPYHAPVFVLTHHPRPPLEMDGGTTFHFVTDGIEAALDRAREAAASASSSGPAAGEFDVRVGGGVATIRQYLQAGLIDEMHLAISPVALGRGENLFAGIDLPALGYRCIEQVASPAALHVVFAK